MSKRGKVDLVSDDKTDSPAPVRRSTRISLGQNLPSSPAPMAIKTRRGSANSSSEEKITIEANSPKEKRKTRRTSTDEDPKPAPLRSRRGSVSKVIEEEKTSIPNSPGRRSTKLSSSSPSIDAPVRRTRRSSQDTDTVEIPARRTTRRSSTGIQESTIEEIVEKAKPITRRRRSSSIDELEENVKSESTKPKTKRLFNEDNHLEPIKEQEQEIKAEIEEKHESNQKLEVIQETTNDETDKIIEDLNEVLADKSSPNENMSKSIETEKCNLELDNVIDTEIKDVESVDKTIKEVNEESCDEVKEQSIATELPNEEDKSTLEDTTSMDNPLLLKNLNNDLTNEKDCPVESPLTQQKNVLKIDETVSYTVTLDDSYDKIILDKKLNESGIISSPGSDKENTSINIKSKRLSIKKLEENSKKEIAEQNGFSIKQTPNTSTCEPMDVDDDEDDLFAVQDPTKNQTPKKLALNESIGRKIEIVEVSEQNEDVVNMNMSIKLNDNTLEGSFSHVNSSPDKESSLLDEKKEVRWSQTSPTMSENKLVSRDHENKMEVDDDCESDTSIKLVDTDDEEDAKISAAKQGENISTIVSESFTEQETLIVPDKEFINASMKSSETDNEAETAKVSQEMKDKSTIASVSSTNQTINIPDSKLTDASINQVDINNENKSIEISNEKEDKNNSLIVSENNQTLTIPDSELRKVSVEVVITEDEGKTTKLQTEKEDENISVIVSETSTNQTLTIPDSELMKTSMEVVFTDNNDEEKATEKEDVSLINSEISTNQTLNVDSELNESVFDKSFDSSKNNSLTEENIKSKEILNTNSVEKEIKKSKDESMVLQEESITPDLNDSKKHFEEDPKTLNSKRQSEGKQEIHQISSSGSAIILSSAEENIHSTKISLGNNKIQNKGASLEEVDLSDKGCVDVKSIEIIDQSSSKCEEVDSRKSPQRNKDDKIDIDDIESLDSSNVQEMNESNCGNNDSKVVLSMVNTSKEHDMNISKISNEFKKTETKEENDILGTLQLNSSKENLQISMSEKSFTSNSTGKSTKEDDVINNKNEEKEYNTLKIDTNPSKKIILRKIEIVNKGNIEIKNEQSNLSAQNDLQACDSENIELSGNHEDNKVVEESSLLKSSTRHSLSSKLNKNNKKFEKLRNSLPNVKINIEENVSKSRISNTDLSKTKTCSDSEDEIHLISSSDDEIIMTKTEESSPIKKSSDAEKSVDEMKKLQTCSEKTLGQENKKVETSKNPKKKKTIKIMYRSGIDVEDDSSVDGYNASNEFIDDMAEEVNDILSEEESDENEIKEIGESVLSSNSDEESCEDDYDLDDPFIDNEEQEELLSGEETFLEEEIIEKPKKKKYQRIISKSSSSTDEELRSKEQMQKFTETSRKPIAEVEEIAQATETTQIREDKFEGMIDSILKLSPEESSTPNINSSGTVNSSHGGESTVILHETCNIGAAKSRVIINKIQGMVDVFCQNINEPEGDISLNVSINYIPPSNCSSSRNSFNASFGNKDLEVSINNSPNKSSRLSLNKDKNKASISPQRPCELVKIEHQNEKENAENDNTENVEYNNELSIKVEEETEILSKKKSSKRKKSKKMKEPSVENQELTKEESNSNKQKRRANKRPVDQEQCKTSPENRNSQTKKIKKDSISDTEILHPPLTKKKKIENNHSNIKNNVCEGISSVEPIQRKNKKIESKETRSDTSIKNNTEKKSKRPRDVSEPTLGRKKVKYNESDMISNDLQPREVKKKLKSEKYEENIQEDTKKRKRQKKELVSKINKSDQSQMKITNVKEIKPKKSERGQKETENVGSTIVEYKTNHGNEWDEEEIFVKPSAANDKSGFNFETYRGDFKTRMIYDSFRNRRETSARSKSQRKAFK